MFSHSITNLAQLRLFQPKGKRNFSKHVTLVLQTIQGLPMALRVKSSMQNQWPPGPWPLCRALPTTSASSDLRITPSRLLSRLLLCVEDSHSSPPLYLLASLGSTLMLPPDNVA